MIGFATDFASYLNHNGYSVSEEQIGRFFRMTRSDDVDITNVETAVSAMKICFCHTGAEAWQFRERFEEFYRNWKQILESSNKEDTLRQSIGETERKTMKTEGRIGRLRKEIVSEEDRTRREYAQKAEFSLRNQKKLDKAKATISKLKLSDKKRTDFIKKCIMGRDYNTLIEYKEEEIKSIRNEIYGMAEEALKKGNMKRFEACTELYKAVDHLLALPKAFNAALQKEIDKRTNTLREQLLQLEKESKAYETLRRKQQKEIGRLLKEVREKQTHLVIKEMARKHRKDFYGTGAVQTFMNTEDKVFFKPYKSLTQEEKQRIFNYIRKNVLRFKTRMTRNIHTERRRDVDIKETIRSACHTGGIPLILEHNRPARSKADLILILDVSGSCRDASEMMLGFIGILKEVFPRGCKAFAFVNSLYDISDIYESIDLNDSIKKALDMVTRGYSNYYVPLKTLWDEYRPKITKDSIVIFIGDARNNQNKSGEDFMKNICRKAKSAYFLNTEEYEKWNKEDSIAAVYGKYAKMHEVLNANGILRFLEKLK